MMHARSLGLDEEPRQHGRDWRPLELRANYGNAIPSSFSLASPLARLSIGRAHCDDQLDQGIQMLAPGLLVRGHGASPPRGGLALELSCWPNALLH